MSDMEEDELNHEAVSSVVRDDDEEAGEEIEQSQRALNESMMENGTIEVKVVAAMPGLRAPNAKEMSGIGKPYRPPKGCAPRAPDAPKRTIGMVRKGRYLPIGGSKPFKPPTPPELAGPSPEMLAAMAAAQASAVQALPVKPEEPPAPVVEMPPGYEPLVLYEDPGNEEAASVVVEDFLGVQLRPHQRDGLSFMFQCIHGLAGRSTNGCLLADDMGLGKTFQSIALIYTVLRQGLLKGRATCRRVVVVAPTSVLHGWQKDVKKFIGDRLKLMVLADKDSSEAAHMITSFLASTVYPVLVISYETYRKHAARFTKEGACDLLICDEAHRLKNEDTQLNKALSTIACKRRILLTGTPVQNNLDEYYAMMDFACPGCLGDYGQFRKRYAIPIMTGREPSATDEQKEAGAAASEEMSAICNRFVLRRQNTLLMKYLPPKRLSMVMVRLTPFQEELRQVLMDNKVTAATLAAAIAAAEAGDGGAKSGKKGGGKALELIIMMRKLIAHPRILFEFVRDKLRASSGQSYAAAFGRKTGTEEEQLLWQMLYSKFPPEFERSKAVLPELGGKFYLVSSMMARWRRTTNDRVVLVSGFTETLDVFERLFVEKKWTYVRLDGAVAPKKRSDMINRFNNPNDDVFCFMLSTRAGGAGINLPGGNRLILFDPDWNPANDLQAAGRIHRDGQRKKVFVYRLFAAGTLEEKILQRQLSKKGMQTTLVEGDEEKIKLDSEDLRNLFEINPHTDSDTHDMLRCGRCRKDELAAGDSDTELSQQKKQEKELRGMIAQEVRGKRGAEASPSASPAGSPSSSRSSSPAPSPAMGPSKAKPQAKAQGKGGAGAGSSSVPKPAPSPVSSADEVLEVDDEDDDGDVPLGGSRAGAGSSAAGPSPKPAAASDDGKDSDSESDSSGSSSGSSSSNSSGGLTSSGSSSSGTDTDSSGAAAKPRAKAKAKTGAKRKAPKQRGPSKAATKRAAVARKKASKEEAKDFQALFRAKTKGPLAPVAPGTWRRQLKLPAEEDLLNWSHHTGVAGVGTADDVLAAIGGLALEQVARTDLGDTGRGGAGAGASSSAPAHQPSLVSFAFGLEVPGRDLAEINRDLDEKAKVRAVEEEKERRMTAAAEITARMVKVKAHMVASQALRAGVKAAVGLSKAGAGAGPSRPGMGMGMGMGMRPGMAMGAGAVGLRMAAGAGMAGESNAGAVAKRAGPKKGRKAKGSDDEDEDDMDDDDDEEEEEDLDEDDLPDDDNEQDGAGDEEDEDGPVAKAKAKAAPKPSPSAAAAASSRPTRDRKPSRHVVDDDENEDKDDAEAEDDEAEVIESDGEEEDGGDENDSPPAKPKAKAQAKPTAKAQAKPTAKPAAKAAAPAAVPKDSLQALGKPKASASGATGGFGGGFGAFNAALSLSKKA